MIQSRYKLKFEKEICERYSILDLIRNEVIFDGENIEKGEK